MPPCAAATDPTDPFAASRSAFTALTVELSAEPAARLGHAELEELLDLRGRDLLRQLLQDHLELRQVREERAVRACPVAVTGADGVTRAARSRPGTAGCWPPSWGRSWWAGVAGAPRAGSTPTRPMRPCACPGCGRATGCGGWPPLRRCAARSTRPPRRSVAAAGRWPASGRSSS